MNSMLRKIEKFKAPSMKTRAHQMPVGSCRTIRSNSNPAGSARSIATVVGEKFGKNSVVMMYVLPQIAGAIAVSSKSEAFIFMIFSEPR